MFKWITTTIKEMMNIKRKETRIENKLNNHFEGFNEKITTHTNKKVELIFQSITIRPKYKGENVGGGIEKVEHPNIQTEYSTERNQTLQSEKIFSKLFNNRIAFVELNIKNGDARDILPEYIDAQLLCLLMYPNHENPIFTLEKTHITSADKVIIKMNGVNRISQYRKQLFNTINFIIHIQQNIKYAHVRAFEQARNGSSTNLHLANEICEFLFDNKNISRLESLWRTSCQNPGDVDTIQKDI